MEHRWGKRISVDIAVPLRSRWGALTIVRMVNVSRTGALIRTNAPVPLFARVDIHIDGQSLPSFVVRTDGDHIAVEWCEPSPAALRSLLHPEHTGVDLSSAPSLAGDRAA